MTKPAQSQVPASQAGKAAEPQVTTPQAGSNYINLHAVGIGYLKRIRNVKVRGGSFVGCSINAMHGEKGVDDGIRYTPFDVKATTQEMANILQQFMADSNDPKMRLMVQFKIGDFTPESFTLQNGDRAGQIGINLKGRLIQIYKIWSKDVGGNGKFELVYERPAKDDLTPAENTEADQQAAA